MGKFKVLKYNLRIKNPETRVFLKFLCHVAKNVYNNALYALRQQYFSDKTIPTYFNLNKFMKDSEDSKIMNSFITVCINREAHNAMSNFVHHKVFKMPKYLPKKGYFSLITEDGNVLRKLRVGNTIQFPLSNLVRTGKIKEKKYEDKEVQDFLDSGNKMEYFYIKIPKVIEDKEIKRLSIIPKFDCRYFEVSFTYVD
ncbi:MAG: hypothetical protein MJ068_04625, partial [Clostridia bacterium]|nr:hypothetical protein [Clostridia bacterium]